jgi:hypothetical protein
MNLSVDGGLFLKNIKTEERTFPITVVETGQSERYGCHIPHMSSRLLFSLRTRGVLKIYGPSLKICDIRHLDILQ